MTQISRTQAWCKLAVLIADGMPAPTQIAIDKHGVVICLDTVAAFQAWAEKLCTRTPSAPHRGEKRWSYTASGEWCGMDLVLSAYVPIPTPEPITEDMTRVREVAEHGGDEPRCPDPECGEPLAEIASGAVGHCGRSCAPVEAGAVSE